MILFYASPSQEGLAMVDSKAIEQTLKPHMESLRCIIDVTTDKSGRELIDHAASAQLLLTPKTDKKYAAHKQTFAAVAIFFSESFQPMKNGEIDFSTFTKEVINGLWAVCSLTSSKIAKQEVPALRRRLRAQEFDFHALLAATLHTLR